MGIWSWLTGGRAGEPSAKLSNTATLSGDGSFAVCAVGESHYQQALEAICGGREEDGVEHQCIAELVLETNNRYDPNAVRIDIDGRTVGYLSRQNAVEFRESLGRTGAAGRRLFCEALIVGGWDRGDGDRGHFGVKLDLA